MFLFCSVFLLILNDRVVAKLLSLPYGARAESVTQFYDNDFLASDFYTGNIYQINANSGATRLLVRPPSIRMSLGLYESAGLIFVAGGINPLGRLYVYDLASGREVANCKAPHGKLINDVVTDSNYAYFTDSLVAAVYRMRIASLPSCDIDIIQLPRRLFHATGVKARGNGIVMYAGGLIVSNTALKNIYFVDLLNGNKVTEILPVYTLTSADGMDIHSGTNGDVLFIAEPQGNLVSIWSLSKTHRSIRANRLGKITSNKFISSTAVAIGNSSFMVTCFNLDAPYVWSPTITFSVFIGFF